MRTGCVFACFLGCFFVLFFGMVRVTAAAEALCFHTSLPLPLLARHRRLPDGREHRVDRSDSLNDEALSAKLYTAAPLSSLEAVDPKCFAPY